MTINPEDGIDEGKSKHIEKTILKMAKKTFTEPGLEPKTSGLPYQHSPI